jgi:hypothetical protein
MTFKKVLNFHSFRPSKKREKDAENRTSSGGSVDKLPKIAVAGALVGGTALAASTFVASDPEQRHPEIISDTDYSRPETEASDALPSDAEHSSISPQPHSDVEPEFQQEHDQHELEQATPKEENPPGQMFNYEPSHQEPVIEDPIHKIEHEPVETERQIEEEFTPVEEHVRHARSVESQPPVSERSIEDDYTQHEAQAFAEPTQNEAAYDSAIYSSESNPLQDEQKLDETPRSLNEAPQSDDDSKSEATHNAEHSAFSPRSMNEDELSPHNEEHRNETPMSKDSIEPAEEHIPEPVSHFEVAASPKHDEFEDQTPLQETHQFGEEQMNTSIYQHEHPESPVNTYEHEPVQHDFEQTSEPIHHEFEQTSEPIQHNFEQESEPIHHDFEQNPESPSVQMHTSVYQEPDDLPIQHDSPIQHNEPTQNEEDLEHAYHAESPNAEMSQSFSHHQEEVSHPEDEISSVKEYHQEHRGSLDESESEPNLHYQTESFQPVESKPEEIEHNVEESRFKQNFDLSNDNSIPVMEGK